MDKQRPVNKVAHNDAYSSTLMEMYTNWMDGDCFQGSNIPEAFVLTQNYPNPFNPTTTLRYELPQRSYVTLTIYNMLGEKITQLVNAAHDAGLRSVQWDAKDSTGRPVSTGIYFSQLRAGNFVQTRKMVLMK